MTTKVQLVSNIIGNVSGGANFTGIVTATSFVGALTGTATTATGLSGTPNITVGIVTATNVVIGGGTTQLVVTGNARVTGVVTASSFVGELTGTATTATGLSGTPNLNVGIVTATSLNASGVVTASSFSGSGSGLSGVSTNFVTAVGIQSAGTVIGAGITQLNFIGVGNTFAVNGTTVNISIKEFSSGTAILFYQASAPTGWTKSTTHNNKALRVVSGSGGGSGGSTEFTSVFTSRTPSGSVSGTNSGGSVSAHTLTVSEMPSHSHGIHHHPGGAGTLTGTGLQMTSGGGTDSTGGSQAHSHGFTNPSWTGSFTGSAMDFAVQYIDVIICTKG
jgi:hypothetical protein